MTSINNSGILQVCSSCGCAAFAPIVNYTYVPGTPNIVFTDATTFDAGDSFKKINFVISDQQGIVKYGSMANQGSGLTFNTATFGGGALLTLPINSGGSGYLPNASYIIVISGGGGSGATVVGNTNSAGVFTSTTVTAGGTLYTSAPTGTLTLLSTAINLTGLVLTYGINIMATVVTTKRCIADLIEYRVGASISTVTSQVGNTANEVDKDAVQDTE